jgi:hypothetical protein
MAKANASLKALRALTRNNNSIDSIPARQMPKHLKELSGRNDRLQAVVCATIVDSALVTLIETVMYKGPGTLFDINQPLSTFSSKIDLAYSLGLIDNDVRRNADYIREIRNVFAHRLLPIKFRTREVAAVCKLLKLGELEGKEEYKTNMRARFLAASIRTAHVISARGKAETLDLRQRLERNEPPLMPASLL